MGQSLDLWSHVDLTQIQRSKDSVIYYMEISEKYDGK